MKSKSHIALLVLLVLLVVGVTLLTVRVFQIGVSPIVASKPSAGPISRSVLPTEKIPDAMRSPLVRAAVPGRRKLRPLVKAMPSIREIRAQVRANPHETPQALLAFAYVLAERLGPALENESAAKNFLPDLQACALTNVFKTLASVRSLCLVNARKLALKFPSLGREFDDLVARADGEAVQLAARFE